MSKIFKLLERIIKIFVIFPIFMIYFINIKFKILDTSLKKHAFNQSLFCSCNTCNISNNGNVVTEAVTK
jgi:hypothetical protein